MKNKWLLCIIVPLFMSGCVSSSIDYVDNESVHEVSASGSTSEHIHEVEKVWDENKLDGQRWDDEADVVDKDGKKCSVIINADIDMPYDVEDISVYEFTYNKQLTPEQKKHIATSLFGVGKVYSYEDELRPKQFYQYYLDLYHRQLDEAKRDEDKAVIQKNIDEVEEKYKAAPDAFVPADDYMGSSYLGYIDDVAFRLDFDFYEDMNDVMKEERRWETESPLYTMSRVVLPGIQQKHMFRLAYERLDIYSLDNEEWINTEEKCLDRIQNIVELLNFDETTILDEAFKSGDVFYQFINYTQGPKKVYPPKTTYANVVFCEKMNDVTIPYPGSLIQGNYLTGEWISVTGYAFCELLSQEKGVKLMQFENIIELIKNELTKNIDRYKGTTQLLSYDSLQFSYYEYANETGDKIMMLPCWCLSSTKNVGNPVYINALDGTVLYLFDPCYYYVTKE